LVIVRVIAIDGPAGAGKSTVAREVARATGLEYLDTGAMYRCVALSVLREHIDPFDAEAVGLVARSVSIDVQGAEAFLDGENVSTQIRTPEISNTVSIIAAHTPVRDAMRMQQRQWIKANGGGVVEGRDIGTVVFPDAVLKIFLWASPEVRAKRRVDQTGDDFDEVVLNITERDRIDSTRSDSPLRPADDAVSLDSSSIAVDDVVASIVQHFDERDGR
jgi:cytidylate kinase